MKLNTRMKYMNPLNNLYFTIAACFSMISCGGSDQARKKFDTRKVLNTARLNIQMAFESSELREKIRSLAPSQVFHTLGQFYGYSYNFGMPGYKEWELSDGWGRPIRFSMDGDIIYIWSVGPDGVNQSGLGDDIKITIAIQNHTFPDK